MLPLASLENWTETNDRESALIGATLGMPLRRWRPITEVWNERTEQCITYHFIGKCSHPSYGELTIGQVTAIVTGAQIAKHNSQRRLSPYAIHVVTLLRDFIRNWTRHAKRWEWAKDRIVAIICLTLGMKFERLHTSIVSHVSFVSSFPIPATDSFLGQITARQVEAIIQKECVNIDPKLIDLVVWMCEAEQNMTTFEEWMKNKVVPMVQINGKRFDMTVAVNAPAKTHDAMRRMERRA